MSLVTSVCGHAGRVAVILGLAPAVFASGAGTKATFAVSETGTATVSVPIQVPRGIAGVEPQLSLNYSNGGGNGSLGIGWSVGGLSAITRCPKSKLHDGERGAVNFSKNDRYCLDGQRLLSTSSNANGAYSTAGTEYRLERDNFSRITAIGTHISDEPQGFKVETKSGLVMEFGADSSGSADGTGAVIMAAKADPSNPSVGPQNKILRWMLRRISDRTTQPSSVQFYYCIGEVNPNLQCEPRSTGIVSLHYIQYSNRSGQPGSSAVVFGYEAREDRSFQFYSGAVQRQTQRLSYIATFIGFSGITTAATRGSRVKAYEFTYESLGTAQSPTRLTPTSRLVKIQEIGNPNVDLTSKASRSSTDALPPLDFVYAPDNLHGQVFHQDPLATAMPPKTIVRPRECGGYAGPGQAVILCP
jgi:Salmonella virulence plasmid 65kDa B protein